MSRREYTIRLVCAHDGCKETSFTTATTRRDEVDIRKRYNTNPYHCYRHSKPDEVLSSGNPELQAVVVSEERAHGKYWGSAGGLISGPGFRAIADDFPPGTKLIVTARIELPSEGEL